MKPRPEFTLTLRYWPDKGWLVGQVLDMPGVVTQGRDLA